MPQCAECKAPICWTEKTKLEKTLIVCVILTSALAIAISCAYLATILVGKDKEKETKTSKHDNVCLTESCLFSAAAILKNMDSTVPPCEDFYNFACGNFVKKTIIPEDQGGVDMLMILKNSLKDQMKHLLEEPIETNELKPFKMIKKIYKTCMNVDLIEKDGLNTIRTILKDLGGWPVLEGDKWAESRFDWKNLTYKFSEIGFFDVSLLKIFVGRHFLHSNRLVLYIFQPPSDRKAKDQHKRTWTEEEVQKAYFRYMVDTAVQFGADRNRCKSELEEAFAVDGIISDMSNKTFNRAIATNFTTLQQTFPNFTWMKFINNLLAPHNVKVRADQNLIVNLNYVKGLDWLLQTASKRTIANYMIWRFIYYCAPFLNRALREAHLKYKQVFTGISRWSMRYKYCLDIFMVAPDLGDIRHESLFIAVGALYVRKYFDKKDKKDAQEMISNIYRLFEDTLEHTEWMDPKTRKKALDKAKAMIMNTAYPDEFLNDSKLLEFYADDIKLEENYLKSVLKLNHFDIRHHFKRLEKPDVSRKDWIEQGQVVMANAFYSPQTNSINVPVGILQNQTFSNLRPNYLNYGVIGAAIGHEFTHGFDDNGRNFDKEGNIAEWWTAESKKSFVNKAACIVKQYSKYKIPEFNMTVNGNLTINENIADNGGFITSYKAYKKWVEKHGTEKTLPGLNYTPNQLFWISVANFWCSKKRPENLQHTLLKDEHSPGRFRVIGPLSNFEEFANDFHCSVGSKMNPKQKCKLW